MKKFPLEWLITVKKNELKEIEVELSTINNKISENENVIIEKQEFIKVLKSMTRGTFDSWKISMAHKSIKDCNGIIKNLENKREFLLKEKNLISQRYKNKDKELEALRKQKNDFISIEKQKIKKKEEAELNELSLLMRGEYDDDEYI